MSNFSDKAYFVQFQMQLCGKQSPLSLTVVLGSIIETVRNKDGIEEDNVLDNAA